VFEEERKKRLLDMQHSIEKLNIPAGDKMKLKKEVENLNGE
jgi:uncharacterized protein YlxW (UPF0749 family)